ncbi:MAG: TetR family transcriptional regulator [Dechloromonas sp.]|nr:TetR family transcriptional regulator [Dechloromonas sp.]
MARKTKEDALITRNRILDSAVEVFSRQGVSPTSLKDVAKEAGVTRGAIYWHFPNKLAMFEAMIQRLVCPLRINADDHALRMAANPLLFLQEVVDEVFGKMLSDPSFRKVFEIFWHKCEYVGDMAAIRDCHLDEGKNHIDILCEAFALAQDKGQIDRSLTAHQATIAMVGMIDGLLFNWTKNPQMFPLNDYARPILTAFFSSLGATDRHGS